MIVNTFFALWLQKLVHLRTCFLLLKIMKLSHSCAVGKVSISLQLKFSSCNMASSLALPLRESLAATDGWLQDSPRV